MERKLKLYVWEDIFADWYPGMAVALAYDVRTARQIVLAKYGSDSDWARAELAAEPTVIRLDDSTRPQAWYVTGGG